MRRAKGSTGSGSELFRRGTALAALAITHHGLVSSLHEAAASDPLTGLANRATFENQYHQWFSNVAPTATAGALYFIDLDDFKEVNDTHGHAIGDELLVLVAKRLKNAVRSTDLIARIGGDEFAVLANLPVNATE